MMEGSTERRSDLLRGWPVGENRGFGRPSPLHAFTAYHSYRKAYWRARVALDWFYAWHLATEEVLEPLGSSLQMTQEHCGKHVYRL